MSQFSISRVTHVSFIWRVCFTENGVYNDTEYIQLYEILSLNTLQNGQTCV